MKKLLSLILVIGMMVHGVCASAATMYALDGRTLEVDDSEIEAYRRVSWYYGKPVKIYALDGRTLMVGENDVEMYRQVGWFYGKPVTMYAPDGRTLKVGENDVEMYRQVGWYATPPEDKYRNYDYSKILRGDLSDFTGECINAEGAKINLKADGTEGLIAVNQRHEFIPQIADGFALQDDGYYTWGAWWESADIPDGNGFWLYPVGVEIIVEGKIVKSDTSRVRMYAGHDFYPPKEMPNKVYYRPYNQMTGKYVRMYSLDGRMIEVKNEEVEAHRQVGWYYGKPVTMYSLDGRTLAVGENDIEMYRQVGWFYGKPVKMYAPDGRIITVGQNDVNMYKAVGWYTSPIHIHKNKVSVIDSWIGNASWNFTEPSYKGNEVFWGATLSYNQEWCYPAYGVTLEMDRMYLSEPQSVVCVRIEAPCPYQTSKGIKIGSSKNDVIRAYGSRIDYGYSAHMDGDSLVVDDIYDGIIFRFVNDKVSEILLGYIHRN